jgi:lipopolysaccharide transport system ATP-binding protein
VIAVHQLGKCYHVYERPQDRLKQALIARLPLPGGRSRPSYFREFWALRDVSFEVGRGAAVGILGRNGAGKSTLLQLIAGTLSATCGSVSLHGRVAALLELGSGFNPEFTGRENVWLNASLLGLSRRDIEARFDEIAAFADIGDFLDQPVKKYSSGMVMRLAFAVQTAVDPDVLIIDEALAVGDARFQKKCYARLEKFRAGGGTVLFVTHDAGTVVEICSHALILEQGRLYDQGPPHRIARVYHELLFGAAATAPTLLPAPNPVAAAAQAPVPQPAAASQPATGTRYGDRDVEITRVSVRDADGRDTAAVEVHGAYELRFEVRYNRDIAGDVSYGFMLATRKGMDIFGTKSAMFGAFLPPGRAGARFACSYRTHLPLVPGIYFLTVAVAPKDAADAKGEFYDCWFDALELRVVGSPPCFLTGVVDLAGALGHQELG